MQPLIIARSPRTPLAGAVACGFLLTGLALTGCGSSGQGPPETRIPEVQVSRPVSETVTDFEDFTGTTVAVKGVDVRARVTGYLEKVLFKEGAEVKEGDRLFVIDPRTYQADYDHALANLAQAKAHLERVTADYKRAQELLPMNAISKSDFDLAKGDHDEGAAAVEVAEAAVQTAKLNLDWTVVTAPISGRISWQRIDPGNLVQADNTILTTIVSLDPVYAYFYVDERSMLRFRRLLRAGKVKSAQEARLPVLLGLLDEEGYPHKGTIDFVDNAEDQMTRNAANSRPFPESRESEPDAFSRHVGPHPRTHRQPASGPDGFGAGVGIRPGGAADPLRDRPRQQGDGSAREGRPVAEWPAGDRGRPVPGRAGRAERLATDQAGHGSQADRSEDDGRGDGHDVGDDRRGPRAAYDRQTHASRKTRRDGKTRGSSDTAEMTAAAHGAGIEPP